MDKVPSLGIKYQNLVFFLGLFFAIIGFFLVAKSAFIFLSFFAVKKGFLNLLINSLAYMLSGFTILVAGMAWYRVVRDPVGYFREIQSWNINKLSRHQMHIIIPLVGWIFFFFYLSIYPSGGFVLDGDSMLVLLLSAFLFTGHLPIIFQYKKKVESYRRRRE
jgi:hypothetical protein